MVVQPDLPNRDLSEGEYKRKESEIRSQMLAKFLQAMREDLAEWISSISFKDITHENFLMSLENGKTISFYSWMQWEPFTSLKIT